MPFEKGHKKSPGRRKGSLNKVTAEVRSKFSQLVDSYSWEELKADLDSLEPKDRLSTLATYAEFVLPKLQRTQLSTDEEGSNGITIQIIDKGTGKK